MIYKDVLFGDYEKEVSIWQTKDGEDAESQAIGSAV